MQPKRAGGFSPPVYQAGFLFPCGNGFFSLLGGPRQAGTNLLIEEESGSRLLVLFSLLLLEGTRRLPLFSLEVLETISRLDYYPSHKQNLTSFLVFLSNGSQPPFPPPHSDPLFFFPPFMSLVACFDIGRFCLSLFFTFFSYLVNTLSFLP